MGTTTSYTYYIGKAPTDENILNNCYPHYAALQEVMRAMRFKDNHCDIESVSLFGCAIKVTSSVRNGYGTFSDEFDKYLDQCYVVEETYCDGGYGRSIAINGELIYEGYVDLEPYESWDGFPDVQGIDVESCMFFSELWPRIKEEREAARAAWKRELAEIEGVYEGE